MTTQRERDRYRAAQAAAYAESPVVHAPKEGQVVVYRHPAGPVQGTITAVTRQAVEVTVKRANDLPDLVLKFTKRAAGEYRLMGKGLGSKPLYFVEGQ